MIRLPGHSAGRGAGPWHGGAPAGSFTDVHCHCLPGLDDGPRDRDAALNLCRALVGDGVTVAVATPHQLGRFDGAYDAPRIRQEVAELNRALQAAGVALRVLPGADVRLDERIPDLLESDQIMTVADRGEHLLLELPHEVFIDPSPLLARLDRMGVRAVITHPERCDSLIRRPDMVRRWSEYEPCLQVTAASFTGRFGPQVQNAAWAFLHQSLPVLVASDAHDLQARAPHMTGAYQALAERLGEPIARALCVENPLRLVSGSRRLTLTAASHGRETQP